MGQAILRTSWDIPFLRPVWITHGLPLFSKLRLLAREPQEFVASFCPSCAHRRAYLVTTKLQDEYIPFFLNGHPTPAETKVCTCNDLAPV